MDEIRNDYLIGNYLLKDYKIKKELGEGAFGKVYIVEKTTTGEHFAAKLVSNKIIIYNTLFQINIGEKYCSR